MGDDLGDDWVASDLGSGDEETSAAASVTSKAIKNKEANAENSVKSGGKNKAHASDAAAASTGGRKRGRSQLSPEGFEEDESDAEGDEVMAYGSEDEEKRLAEEEAKRVKAEKKKQKLKALKAKHKEKKRQRLAEENEVNEGGGGGGDGGRGKGEKGRRAIDATSQAAELWAKFCKVRGELVTPLELDRPWVTAESLARVEGFGAHTLVKLVGFIKASLPDWKKRIQNRNNNAPRGGPSVLIVCAGARRCVEVMKHLTAFRCQVVKLFAKHLKIEEQKVMLKKGCFPLAVGTPGRMQALAASGALRFDSAALLILDMEKNVKGRDVVDMDGVAKDTMELLTRHARPQLVSLSTSRDGEGKGVKEAKGNAGQLRIALY